MLSDDSSMGLIGVSLCSVISAFLGDILKLL